MRPGLAAPYWDQHRSRAAVPERLSRRRFPATLRRPIGARLMRNQPTGHTGRHFLQIPGPTNVPDRVLQAIAKPTIDHRGPEFATLGQEVVAGMRRVFQTEGAVVVYPSSGTGAWEAAIVNTLSPGDKVLMFETGQFAVLWHGIASKFKLDIDFVPGDWRHGADIAAIEQRLAADKSHSIKAVMVVHNET